MGKLALLFVILASVISAEAQAPRVKLDLGSVTVWLGMDMVQAKQQLKAAGMTLSSEREEDILVISPASKSLYSLRFSAGKLVYAARDWLNSDSLPSVIGAFAALASEGAKNCSILHAPIASPEGTSDRVSIDCGERGVLLIHGELNGMKTDAIWERIGR